MSSINTGCLYPFNPYPAERRIFHSAKENFDISRLLTKLINNIQKAEKLGFARLLSNIAYSVCINWLQLIRAPGHLLILS